jgi:hypothetical protein
MTFRLVAVSPAGVAYFWVGVAPPVVDVVEPEPALPVVVVAPPVVVAAFVLVAPAPVYVAPPVLVEVEVVAPALSLEICAPVKCVCAILTMSQKSPHQSDWLRANESTLRDTDGFANREGLNWAVAIRGN